MIKTIDCFLKNYHGLRKIKREKTIKKVKPAISIILAIKQAWYWRMEYKKHPQTDPQNLIEKAFELEIGEEIFIDFPNLSPEAAGKISYGIMNLDHTWESYRLPTGGTIFKRLQ